jgi:hypothetical protein
MKNDGQYPGKGKRLSRLPPEDQVTSILRISQFEACGLPMGPACQSQEVYPAAMAVWLPNQGCIQVLSASETEPAAAPVGPKNPPAIAIKVTRIKAQLNI